MKPYLFVADGFLSLGLVDIGFEGRKGLTLVEGENRDSTADSNGAGKSSLFEGMLWNLFGVTRRGYKGDEVINRHQKGGAFTQFEFETKGNIYTVIRTRRYKKLDTCLRLFVGSVFLSEDGNIDTEHADFEEITKGTAKDTQALLEEIIGMSRLTFEKCAFFGQGDVKPFASLSDSERKTVFEQAMNLTQLSEDAARVNGYRKAKQSTIDSMQVALDGVLTKNKMREEEKVTHVEAVRIFDEEKKKEMDSIRFETNEIAKACSDIEENIKATDADLEANCKTLIEATEKLAAVQKMQLQFNDKYTDVSEKRTELQTRFKILVEETNSLKYESEKVTGDIGKNCSSCGQFMSHEAMQATIDSLKSKMKETAKTAMDTQKLFAEKDAERSKMDEISAPFKAKFAEIEKTVNVTEKAIATNKEKLIGMMTLRDDYLRSIEKLKYDLTKAEAKTNEAAIYRIKILTEAIKIDDEKISDLKATMAGFAHEIEMAELLERGLGNGGIKSLIFDNVTPTLNKYANQFLSDLDPGMICEISTVTKLKSGELREKFSLNVETATGASDFNGHSGGEKQKINLSVALAFNKLMRSISPVTPDFLILDEPFESLDAGSAEQVVSLLKHIDASNMFLITHNQDVKDLVPERIKVIKEGGVARIE